MRVVAVAVAVDVADDDDAVVSCDGSIRAINVPTLFWRHWVDIESVGGPIRSGSLEARAFSVGWVAQRLLDSMHHLEAMDHRREYHRCSAEMYSKLLVSWYRKHASPFVAAVPPILV